MGYQYLRPVTIDHTKVPNTDRANFPVRFSGTYAYLATVANGGNVENANGYDIIFTSDAGGVTQLDHEIDFYDPVTGTVDVHVRVPTVSHTADTVIYLWYGNSAITTSQENAPGVWDSGFLGVYHEKEAAGGAGAIKDSTSHARHLTDTGGPTFGVTGQIGKAISFDGSNDYLSIVASIVPTGNAVKTVSAWFKSVTTIGTRQWLVYAGTETTRGRFAMEIESSKLNLNYQSAALVGATTLISGQWYHGVIVSDGSLIKVYLNGAEDASGSPAGGVLNTGTTVETFLAAFKTPSLFLNGLMDEIRLSDVVRSADWIATEYANQVSPSTFYTVGDVAILLAGTASLVLTGSADLTTAIQLAGSASLALTSVAGLTTAISMAGAASLSVNAASELTTFITGKKAGWLATKGAGPWGFIPQEDKFGYRNNPRWTKQPASLVEHEPCGYWWKCR